MQASNDGNETAEVAAATHMIEGNEQIAHAEDSSPQVVSDYKRYVYCGIIGNYR